MVKRGRRIQVWPWRGRIADAALAAVTALVTMGMPALVDAGAVSAAGWLVMATAAVAVFFRRDFPVLVALVTWLLSAVYLLMPDPDGPIVIAFAIALYTLMAIGKFVAAGLFAAVTVVAAFYGEFSSEAENLGDVGVVFFAGWIVSVMAIGGAVYNRRAYLQEAEQRVRAAERIRSEELRRRATEERLGFARELHDVLGHTISLINVQASAALHQMGAEPGQTGDALRTIKQTSHEALQELRNTLGVLRQVDEDAPTAPAPSLSRVDELVGRVQSAELTVTAELERNVETEVPPAVDLAGYRIVQEALTNVTRHSGASEATVRIHVDTDDVEIQVDDNGRGGTPDGDETASGIVGMQERASSVGGELTAGPLAGGGFRVHARLPLEGRT